MILIIGGAGYIGSHTAKELNKKGYKTVVFDNLSLGHKNAVKWSKFVEGDLKNIGDIRACFETYQPTAVMHFSALANVGESVKNPAQYYENNVTYTLNLLNIMKEFNCKTFIFSSTCATYGIPKTEILTEDHPQDPINPYGKSKLMVEHIVKDYANAYGLTYTFLRYFNAAGADEDGQIGEKHNPETHLIPLAIQATQGTRPALSIFGNDYPTPDGTCIRDYIHVTDLATAHILALEYLQNGGGSDAYNLGCGLGYSVRDIIHAIEEVSGKSVPVTHAPRRAGDPPMLVGSYEKINRMLGWSPQRDLDRIIRSAWEWHDRDLSF